MWATDFDIDDDRVVEIDQWPRMRRRLVQCAAVPRLAGSDGAMNLGVTSVAAPKAASSRTPRDTPHGAAGRVRRKARGTLDAGAVTDVGRDQTNLATRALSNPPGGGSARVCPSDRCPRRRRCEGRVQPSHCVSNRRRSTLAITEEGRTQSTPTRSARSPVAVGCGALASDSM
jgi:hypothetical protein